MKMHKQFEAPELSFRTIKTDAYESLDEIIQDCIRSTNKYGVSQSVPIEGQTNAGKTQFAKQRVRDNPAYWRDDKFIIREWYVQIPETTTVRRLARYMLREIQEPTADIPSSDDEVNELLDDLIRNHVENCVILDDLHHLLNNTPLRRRQIAEWLKQRIKNTKKVWVVLSTVGKFSKIIGEQDQDQLSRLFTKIHYLSPFALDINGDKGSEEQQKLFTEQINKFDEFVVRAELEIGIKLTEKIKRRELLRRIYYATNGVAGYIMSLFIFAEMRMHRKKLPEATLETLSLAFTQKLQQQVKPDGDSNDLLRKKDPFNPEKYPADKRFTPKA